MGVVDPDHTVPEHTVVDVRGSGRDDGVVEPVAYTSN